MTEEEIRALEPALASFLDRYLYCCDYTQTFDHFGTYCRGLLSDLPRKSVEPIALAAGTPVRLTTGGFRRCIVNPAGERG